MRDESGSFKPFSQKSNPENTTKAVLGSMDVDMLENKTKKPQINDHLSTDTKRLYRDMFFSCVQPHLFTSSCWSNT